MFWGFVWSPRYLFGWFLPPFDHPCHFDSNSEYPPSGSNNTVNSHNILVKSLGKSPGLSTCIKWSVGQSPKMTGFFSKNTTRKCTAQIAKTLLFIYSDWSEARSAERSEFITSSRAQCVDRAWILASCKPMVSAMTSYSSLTSRRIFSF